MLRTNLAVILAERQLKITRLSADTGISRTTLTALAQNSSKMVQFETVDQICQYLKIAPDDFFEYLPFSYNFTAEPDFEFPSSDENDFLRGDYEWQTEVFASFTTNKEKVATVQFDASAQAVETEPEQHEMQVVAAVNGKDSKAFLTFYNQMSEGAKTEYRNNMLSAFDKAFIKETSKLQFPECQSVILIVRFPDGIEATSGSHLIGLT